jgi:phage terminase small subunit
MAEIINLPEKEEKRKGKGFKLMPREQIFADKYLICLNATEAAIEAKYATGNASKMGSELLARPHVRAYLDKKLEKCSMDADEVVQLISDIARSNMAEYMVPRLVEHVPRVERKLSDLIKELEKTIDMEEEIFLAMTTTKKEEEQYLRDQQERRNLILRYRIELRNNRKATRIVDGTPVMVERLELDLALIKKDKARGRIKSYANTPNGIKVEMYDADQAIYNMARIHGKYEKDNMQRKPTSKLQIGFVAKP